MTEAKLVTVYIDGQAVSLPKDKNLLEALLERGVNLPYFCWHPEMGSVGACRQCAVVQYRDEDDDKGRIVMSCMTPVTEGALLSVNTGNAASFRKSVVETLMINHPHDCPVCEEGGECHLQDMTVMTGHRNRRYRGTKVTFRNQYLGPLIGHEMNRCITCYRCVRFYQDYAGGHDLGAFASRDRVYFGRAEDGILQNEFAGNLVEVCPTGVFTDKPLSLKYTRKWDLRSAPAVCTGCSLGCNISASERYGELRRIHNRYNHRINGYFLCDRGRFGGDFVNHEARLRQCGIRNDEGKYDAVSAEDAIDYAVNLIGASARVIGIGSPRASIESNHALYRLVGGENFYAGTSRAEGETHRLLLDILSHTPARLPSLRETEDYDAVLILGEDVTNHAPRLALSLRQATRNRAREMAEHADIPAWNDAAVRKLAQDERSPLIVMTPCPDRLDEVASLAVRATPDQIAAAGFAIASQLDGKFPSADTDIDISEIVSTLANADRPLIVSGTGLQHQAVMKAAANIAAALAGKNNTSGLFLCADECNSAGLSLMSDRYLEAVIEGNQVDTAIILENDLTRRLSPGNVSALLKKINHLIVLDHMDNDTTSVSELALPAATFAEAEGTLVNNEGTAQRSYGAFPGSGETRPSWRWLTRIGQVLERPGFEPLNQIDRLIADCERSFPSLKGISQAAPDAGYRKEGMKVARMPHRYSGRTAMNANVSVHEPKPPGDPDSPLTFTMEGTFDQQPSSLRAFVWSPGWNSNQSVNKFQAEIAGSFPDGDPGIRILEQDRSGTDPWRFTMTETTGIPLVRRHHIFGSDELSAYARAISELSPRPCCTVGSRLADRLELESGDGIEYTLDEETHQLEVIVDPDMADDCIAWPFGFTATRHLSEAMSLTIKKAANWTRRESRPDNLIGSDRRR